ncbi:PaaI family thioesterase [Comamonas faecalis]
MTPEDLVQQHWKRRDLPGFMGRAGPLWTRREGDAWAYAILADEAHLNPAGVVHGGALLTLLDHAISSVAWEACGRLPCLTLQLDTHFIGSVRAGQLAQAGARLVRRTGSLAFLRGEVTVEGETVLTAQALMKVVRTAPGDKP